MSERRVLNKLKYLINKKKTTEEICKILEVDLKTLYYLVLALRKENDSYNLVNGVIVKDDALKENPNCINISSKNRSRICFVSDLHYGSGYERIDIVKNIYDLCSSLGIDTIFCCGDVTDGYYPNRVTHERYNRINGAKEMIDYVATMHPYSKKINFYTIGGNHDATFKDTEDVDILEEVAKLRPDFSYLGQGKAVVDFDGVKIQMYHGNGKNKDNLFVRAKRYYDLIPLDEKPDILQLGHIHHSFFTNYEGTYIFQTAALIDQMPAMEEFGLSCERSCWLASLEYNDEGKLQMVNPELKTFERSRKKR